MCVCVCVWCLLVVVVVVCLLGWVFFFSFLCFWFGCFSREFGCIVTAVLFLPLETSALRTVRVYKLWPLHVSVENANNGVVPPSHCGG